MAVGPSIVTTGLRGRVERLLRGEVIQEDLRELIALMRDESSGTATVREIADFLAHPGLRTQGLVTREVQSNFTYLKFMIPFHSSPIRVRDVPASMPDALRANLRRVRSSWLTRIGSDRVRAKTVLETVLSRSIPTSPGRISGLDVRNKEEWQTIQTIVRFIKGGSIFNADDLFEDFYRALRQMNLAKPSEKDSLRKAKAGIALFALIAMHNRTIDLGDGSVADLTIIRDIKGKLGIFAAATVAPDFLPWPNRAAQWVFETKLPPDLYCEPDVAPPDRTPFIGEFVITSRGTLGRVG